MGGGGVFGWRISADDWEIKQTHKLLVRNLLFLGFFWLLVVMDGFFVVIMSVLLLVGFLGGNIPQLSIKIFL